MYQDDTHLYLVQELCLGGDISDMLAVNHPLTEQEGARILQCVLEFLSDIHAKNVCYGDIKPANFVLRNLYPSIVHLMDPESPKGRIDVVAIDFGCCQWYDPDLCLPDHRVTGTPLYMAPEIIKGCHGKEVDVWAAGVMVSSSSEWVFWVCTMTPKLHI